MNKNGQTDKYKTLAAAERMYFEAFIRGLADGRAVGDGETALSPKKIKTLAAEHYERLSQGFHDTLFYPIARLNYTFDEIEQRLKSASPDSMSMTELIKTACRTEEMHMAMIAEYRRNVTAMLEGRFTGAAEHFAEYTRSGTDETVGLRTAIQTIVGVTMRAYALGIGTAGDGPGRLSQTTIVSLLINGMTMLLHDRPIDAERLEAATDIDDLLLIVCRTEENVRIMTDEMNETYMQLIESEGTTPHDSGAN